MRSIALCLFLLVPGLAAAQSTLLILGDSLSAGYGVETDKAWVALLRQKLGEEGYGSWQVVNASISGETTDGGLRRLPALLDDRAPAIVIIELGGNDGLRGFPPQVTRQNIARMTTLAQQSGARVLLIGMQMPPNYGPRYTEVFAAIYPDIAREQDAALVPFFLDGIYDRDGFMQADGIHPTAKGQPQLLANVWPHLKPLLDAASAQ
ncbi:arylesterase [Marinobacter halodurans]|uniref:arylesterase n=1 Tax=Marinobacter halodurans TaxID=2528979 RepID=UPI001F61F6D5|nr:arylesterase [Marinobacter halodurans]